MYIVKGKYENPYQYVYVATYTIIFDKIQSQNTNGLLILLAPLAQW